MQLFAIIPQPLGILDSPTFVGLTLSGKVTSGSFASPVDVTNTRKYGFELHYSGNDYDVTGIRSRARLKTTDTTATAQGAELQAANEDGINAGVLQGALIEAIGKSDGNAATISAMRGALVNTEWDDYDTVTNLKTLHVRTHSRNAAGAGSFGTGYGIYIENEAVGGNGQAYDAGIYFKGTNLSAGNKAFTYGIDFSGGTFGTANIKLSDGSVINDSNGYWGIGTATPLAILHTMNGNPLFQRDDSASVVFQFFTNKGSGRSLKFSNDGDDFQVRQTAGSAGTGKFKLYNERSATQSVTLAFGAPTWSLVLSTAGYMGFGEISPETLAEWTGTAPYLTLHNSTHEDTDGGRESRILFKGEQSGEEETTLAKLEVGHDGVVDDQKAYLDLFINDGDDDDAPTKMVRLDTTGLKLTGAAATYVIIGSSGANTLNRGIRFLDQAGDISGYVLMVPNTIGTDSTMDFYVGGATAADKKVTIGDNGLFDVRVGAITSATMTITASSDDLDVSGVNTVFIDPAAAVQIGGLKGGVDGQHINVICIDDDQNVTVEHATGLGTQDIYMHLSADETLTSHFGGWNFMCDGTNWYDCSHSRHV